MRTTKTNFMKRLNLGQILLCLLVFSAYAQESTLNPTQQHISEKLQRYFALDRETIHLHLNKNVYFNSERIWFKGYITEKKGRSTHPTSNIYVSLLDNTGHHIATQLYFAEQGIFEGHLNIPDQLPSGTFYLRAYTNFMNNFSEDESAVYRVTLVNPADGSLGWQPKINYEELDVQFYPEGGVFLEGVTNTIAFRIADCTRLGLSTEVELRDGKGAVLAKTTSDGLGYGRFDVFNAARDNYKLHFSANGTPHQKSLPAVQATGISLSVNNYIHSDKALVKVKTNAATLAATPQMAYMLVVQQNEAASFAPIKLDKQNLEQTIVIPRSEISAGVNLVGVIAEKDFKIAAQRLIYDPFESSPKSLLNVVGRSRDSIKFTGSTPLRSGSISISVLPGESVSNKPNKPIQAGLGFDNYLALPMPHLDDYLSDFNRKKHYELDTALMTQTPKYDWNVMMQQEPVKKYESDFGLAIKGVINSDNSKKNIYKINLKSTALGFDEFTSLDEKNEFMFKNLLAVDSAKIFFIPKDKTGKILAHRVGSQILNNNKWLLKPFRPQAETCNNPVVFESTLSFPKLERAIALDSINVVGKKNNLAYRNRMGNRTANAFKITDADAHKMLLQFIAANGFNVSRNMGSVNITSRLNGFSVNGVSTMSARTETIRNSLNGPSQTIRSTTRSQNSSTQNPGPVVFIDEVLVPNYDTLDDFSMSRIDEIYLNKHTNDLSMAGTRGPFAFTPNGVQG